METANTHPSLLSARELFAHNDLFTPRLSTLLAIRRSMPLVKSVQSLTELSIVPVLAREAESQRLSYRHHFPKTGDLVQIDEACDVVYEHPFSLQRLSLDNLLTHFRNICHQAMPLTSIASYVCGITGGPFYFASDESGPETFTEYVSRSGALCEQLEAWYSRVWTFGVTDVLQNRCDVGLSFRDVGGTVHYADFKFSLYMHSVPCVLNAMELAGLRPAVFLTEPDEDTQEVIPQRVTSLDADSGFFDVIVGAYVR